MEFRHIFTLIGIIVMATAIAACQTTITPQEQENTTPGTSLEPGTYTERSFDPAGELTRSSFVDEDSFASFVRDHQRSGFSGSYARNTAVPQAEVAMDRAVAPTEGKAAGGSGGSPDYSETNVQVEGIDEGDIIKTDGEYIYTISESTLYIVKGHPPQEADLITTMDCEGSPEGLFLEDDTLAVFGKADMTRYKNASVRPDSGMTYIRLYDVSDPSTPELEKTLEFEGSYEESRLKGDYIYLATSMRPSYRPKHPTPLMRVDGEMQSMQASSIHHYPIPYNSPYLVNIHSISLDDHGTDSTGVMVESGQNLYMSHDNIFLTYTERIREYELERDIMKELLEPYLTEKDTELIQKIKETDNEVLSQQEKEQKIMEVYESVSNYIEQSEMEKLEDKAQMRLKEKLKELEHLEYTIINRISVDEGDVTAEAAGKVPGHIVNQFSMDEQDETFRIATTISSRYSHIERKRTSETNNVYTLDQDLEILDSLEGLAEDESIYSTRFIDDRLYMVTFERVDPFFVIDLGDPENIELLGELKIPGFSRYLHPYDEDTIIGIGRNATQTGRSTGLKASLFDVSDVSDPEEFANFVTEERYAQSQALYEHKAFLFSKEKNLLVIPAYSHSYYRNEGESYNGALVFRITEDGITLRGLIDHETGGYRGPAVQRSLYIGDYLYTKSPAQLRINALEDLEGVKDVTLKQEEQSGMPTY